MNPLLEKHPNLLFRMHSIRMQLQLDTIPNMPAVEQWARSLLAEMEILADSGSEGSAPPMPIRVIRELLLPPRQKSEAGCVGQRGMQALGLREWV